MAKRQRKKAETTRTIAHSGDRYVVVDADGQAVNVIVWNPEHEYDPGDGLELVAEDDYTGPPFGSGAEQEG